MSVYSHPKWRRKRKSVLQNRNYECERCPNKNNLQVHHKRYVSGRKVWQYPDSELEVLCAVCHRKEHGLAGEMKKCEYKGCNWEIEPEYDYCFKHQHIVLDDKMDEASREKQQWLKMKKELERLKGELESGGKDFERYEGLERQIGQLQKMLAKQSEDLTSVRNQSTRQEMEQKKEQKGGFGFFLVLGVAIVIAVALFAPNNSSSNGGGSSHSPSPQKPSVKQYKCFDCGAQMVKRTNGKTGKKFWGCTRYPKCKNSF